MPNGVVTRETRNGGNGGVRVGETKTERKREGGEDERVGEVGCDRERGG